MKIQYIRLHTLSGQSVTKDFPQESKNWTVSQFEEKIAQWNKTGVVDGIQLWHYRLTVSI
ncbi:MAG TPA: hypothetical protein DDY18_09000 [Flavobacterium sp.]|jgi:hypothetical protein|nr:hypothetical protein [Flavobacterium sp.]